MRTRARHRQFLSLVAALAVTGSSATVHEAAAQRSDARPGGFGSSDTDTRAYDKHDFSGLWSRFPQQLGQPACPECGDPPELFPNYGFFGTPPPRTAEGERRFDLNKPARGFELGSEAARERTDLDIGYRRAVLPAFGNDPETRASRSGSRA